MLIKIKNRNVSNKIAHQMIAFVVVLLIFSASFIDVAAASLDVVSTGENYNSMGLIKSQVDKTYFVSEYLIDKTGWDVPRQNCFWFGNELATSYNRALLDSTPYSGLSVPDMLEYTYAKDFTKTKSYRDRWNDMYWRVSNIIVDIESSCGYTSAYPVINGKQLTMNDYRNLYATILNTKTDLDKLLKEIADFYDETYSLANFNSSSSPNKFNSNLFGIFRSAWLGLGNVIGSIGVNSESSHNLLGFSWSSDSIKAFANSISGVIKTFAYFIAVIGFCVNIISSSLQYELLTIKGGVKVFAGVILVKFWIDLSVDICIWVLNIINNLAYEIFSGDGLPVMSASDFAVNGADEVSNDWFDFIGAIINFLTGWIYRLPITLLLIVLIVCVCIVFIKIIARCFELTCLVAVSPIFFATLVGEATVPYFKKFVSAFLSTAMYMVFIAITYSVGTSWINGMTAISPGAGLGVYASSFMTVLPKCLVIIGICFIMVKPPKVLTSLVDG